MTLEEHLARALRDVLRSNALLVNRLRVVTVAAFAAVTGVMTLGAEALAWRPLLVPVAVYLVVAVALAAGGEANRGMLRMSRFAIPVFDMPMVFLIQWINLSAAESKGSVSEFSIALFVCLLMLSALTLSRGQLVISLVLAVGFEQVLQAAAGISLGGRLGGVILFGLAAWMCLYAGRNRLRLVETVTRANARRLRLQRYFSPGVGEILEEHDEDQIALGKECELTVLFTDIRGFTALTGGMSVRDVIGLLNSYHARMVNAVFRNGGTLDKYLGDGLMAYFNAPVGQADHAARAVRCALDMIDELDAFNRERADDGQPLLHAGIGIHTGRAIVGDIGAPHRREFTAIGQAVNLAARLETMTKEMNVDLLVSEATVRVLPEGMAWTDLGAFPVRGCDEPVRLFTPQDAQQRPGRNPGQSRMPLA